MENVDTLLSEKPANADSAPILEPVRTDSSIKREMDSMDDFEHLERDNKQETIEVKPVNAARSVTQGFLDMERELLAEAPRPPSVDQLADKFTDSESDAGESPLHRPVQPQSSVPTVAAPTLSEPTPTLTPAPTPPPAVVPAVVPAVTSIVKPSQPEVKPEPPVVSKLVEEPPKTEPTPQPKPKPVEDVKPSAPPAEPKTSIEQPKQPLAHVIEAEVIFCQMGLDAWFDPQRLHPQVESLMYWRDPQKSGIALGAGLALLIALACCSVVSVFAYVSLLVLAGALGFRIYKNVLQAVQKTNEGHPFKWLLEQDISVPAERAQQLAAAATAHLNAASGELRRLFLVEDLVDSLKFGVLLWCLTYVGACFNGITLIILGWIALFTLPKAYEMNKSQVDANLELARAKINEISAKVRAAVPIGRKTESEKDK